MKRIEKRKAMALAINGSDALGCGCCADYTATSEQAELAKSISVTVQAVVLADEALAATEVAP